MKIEPTPANPPNDIFPIKQTYFEQSQYAQIHKMADNSWWVQKMTTLAWFKCSTYGEASGLRKMIADGYSSMGMKW